MAFDERLADRVRAVLGETDITERRMFGGLAFLLRGHMCVGIIGHDLMVRVGPDQLDSALAEKHARPMDFTGRPAKGMVYVAPAGLRTERSLEGWIDRGVRFTRSLAENARPARKVGRRKARSR